MRTGTQSTRSWRSTVDRLPARHVMAAALAALAVLAGLATLRPHNPVTRPVWVAARDLAGGSPLVAADLAVHRLPIALLPRGAIPPTVRLVGRLVAAPMRMGEPMTDVRLLGTSLLSALRQPGLVAVPVRLADGGAAAAVVRPGDIVDVLATTDLADGEPAGGATVIADGVTVLAVPPRDGSGDGAGLVVIAATRAQASALARAASSARLSLVLRRPP